jgi:hypothetical protein
VTDKTQPWLHFPTPVPGLSRVTLYQDQWKDHILKHSEMLGQEYRVGVVLGTPSVVWLAPDSPDYYLFLNENVRSPHGTSGLVACVDPKEQFLVTAYYDRRASVASIMQGGVVIWP